MTDPIIRGEHLVLSNVDVTIYPLDDTYPVLADTPVIMRGPVEPMEFSIPIQPGPNGRLGRLAAIICGAKLTVAGRVQPGQLVRVYRRAPNIHRVTSIIDREDGWMVFWDDEHEAAIRVRNNEPVEVM